MLLGTTFAWFTDEIESGKNVIQAGNLDIEMYWTKDLNSGSWINAEDDNAEPVFNYDKWEPGYTEVRYVKIKNAGSLSFKYSLSIIPDGEVSKLADVIDVYFVENPTANIASRAELAALTAKGTLRDAIEGKIPANGILLSKDQSKANFYSGEIVVAIALKMRESAGNEYQNLSIGDTFSLKLSATQYSFETDAFGSDYDENAAADFYPGFQGGSAGAAVTSDGQGITTSDVTMSGGDVSAVIPAGVMLADGVTSLNLTVTQKNASDANIQLSESEKMSPLDVHIEGVADGNTVPMLITLKQYLTTGINTGAIKMYHVENGVTVSMTHVANPTNHNEFSYDPSTGDVTLALASFSEVAVVADTNNTWNGTAATAFAGGNGTEANPYLISNADQLAYFRNQVDGGRNFDNEFVKLTANIYLSNVNFDPIGWGYVNTEWNRGGVAGKVFQGTFDGNGKTIYDLYQNGWDLDPDKENYSNYTYTNCGFGLFAAASNATFKNLTINGASVTVECVEAGVLVGLSQNGCKYENIEIHNAKIANYQRPAGGLIGEVSGEGTTTITNVTIGSDVVVGSLWGDFDAPCGGVIGARWDDVGKNPQIEMTNVEVGARMDVYSDVTSAYQWYAYRRAGMLIGNTELTDPENSHLAYAKSFLKCDNVKVYYGDWANYHYAQFTNQDNDWCNNYPWVRVEAGENCSAYSNPRYGVPVVNGVKVSDMDATTLKSTQTGYVERRFNQLYGGGQGVYGQFEHEGVEVINYRYSITYVNDYQVLAIRYVTESGAVDTAYDVAKNLVCEWADVNIGKDKYEFGGWMNAGSTKVTEIPADNTKNIVLYPWFNDPYTARFVDQNGNVVAYCFFHDGDGGLDKLDETRILAEAALPNPGEHFVLDYWEVHINKTDNGYPAYDVKNFAGYKQDVTIYPVYKYDGDVKLIPVDTDSDGIINYYQVFGYSNPNGQDLVEIPASVNGIPITEISGGAFSSYDGVHSITIPADVTYIGNNAFAEKWSGWFDSGESITIYYAGSYSEWVAKEPQFGSNWESGISSSTRIFFLNGGDTVDVNEGYLQASVSGLSNKSVKWNYKTSITSNIISKYTGECDCGCGVRPDKAYWEGVTAQ